MNDKAMVARETSFFSRWELRQRWLDNVQECLGTFSPQWDVSIISPLSEVNARCGGGAGRLSESVRMAGAKETGPSTHSRTGKCMNSQRLRQHAQGLQRSKSDGVPAMRKEAGHRLPSLTKNLSPTDNPCKGKVGFLQ